ncbi:MAG: polyprenyl synthetase family protein [Candidatus Omnitrophica bacterium]|nr:polyprenyl synthetase family protein [Candidatus Omnitrophota bacterium]
MAADYKRIIEGYRIKTEAYLDKILPTPRGREPKTLHEAMRYSVFSGGKRLRPIIVLITGRLFGVKEEKLMPAACGIELMHNFSLIHDDLPSMDNDDFRRGRQTCHKKFGEGAAILAGDALLTLAFETIAKTGRCSLVRAAAEAVGSEGMAGGQALDIIFQGKKIPCRIKEELDALKTGRLFQLCFSVPFFFANTDKTARKRIDAVAENFGAAFQIRDDIEDMEGNAAVLKNRMNILYGKMKKDISFFGEKGAVLSFMVDSLYKT